MAEASGGEEVTTNSNDRIAKSDDTESQAHGSCTTT